MDLLRRIAKGQNKLTKYRAQTIARDVLKQSITDASVALKLDNDYQKLSDEDQQLITKYISIFSQRMIKSIMK